jgi:hypothetical protein
MIRFIEKGFANMITIPKDKKQDSKGFLREREREKKIRKKKINSPDCDCCSYNNSEYRFRMHIY